MGPSRHRAAGFSLIELMVVVTILSILVLAARPSFNKYLANKHSVAAAADVVRLGRRARADSLGLQRAHLLYFEPGAGDVRPFGRVSLVRGNALHCRHENWAPLLATCQPGMTQNPGSSACVDRLDLSHSHWYHRPHALVLASVPAGDEANANTYLSITAPTGTRALCYDAFGRVFWSTDPVGPAMTFSPSSFDPNFAGAFTFVMGLLDDTSGERRYPGMVLSFPLGGNPRRLR